MFLELMATANDGRKFITRGSHSVVSPCTLPPEATPSIVEIMNRHFGKMLIEEIKQITPGNTRTHEDTGFFTSDTSSIASSQGYEMLPKIAVDEIFVKANGPPVIGEMDFHPESDDEAVTRVA